MLTISKDKYSQQIFLLWFILSVVSLAFSGVYSFLPLILRAPFLADLLKLKDFFKVSLIVHVNLAVLVWFLSSSAMLMSIIIRKPLIPLSFIAFFTSMIGSVFIIASPFIGASEAILNNYIPILHNLSFIIGISLFISGISIQVILSLVSYKNVKNNPINLSIYISALTFLVAVICFIKSVTEMKIITKDRFIDLMEYYELLFWGAGHILQFNYIQLIIVVWLVIIARLLPKDIYPIKSYFKIQWINFILVFVSIGAYWVYSLDSYELQEFFTLHMKYIGGILSIIVAIYCCYALLRNYKNNIPKLELTTFLTSLFLISSGGIIGYLISGMNVTIPAHYHGVIIGITVGLMGLFYMLMPQMGFSSVNPRLASLQMILYTTGQFIHIMALAISGGYGVLRKTPGTPVSLEAKIYMGIMGLGGIIALIGGVLFIVIIIKNMKENK